MTTVSAEAPRKPLEPRNGARVGDDPSELSLAALERRILACCDALEDATHEVRERGIAYSDAGAAFDKTYYRSLLDARVKTGAPEYECKAAAMDVACDLNVARKIAETAYEASREAGRNLRSEAELLRTLSANLRPLVER
jgi:hypothetical protein